MPRAPQRTSKAFVYGEVVVQTHLGALGVPVAGARHRTHARGDLTHIRHGAHGGMWPTCG